MNIHLSLIFEQCQDILWLEYILSPNSREPFELYPVSSVFFIFSTNPQSNIF